MNEVIPLLLKDVILFGKKKVHHIPLYRRIFSCVYQTERFQKFLLS